MKQTPRLDDSHQCRQCVPLIHSFRWAALGLRRHWCWHWHGGGIETRREYNPPRLLQGLRKTVDGARLASSAPYTLHPTPYTLHPAPYTLHPAPCTLHSQY
ncbi:hypothetical protein T484DRAFT_2821738 [Baffinella frigidus]|nr:hypothetical protein T484DRAFT_2821738 [Cryptophyta sp. CCMP2293]